MKLLAVGGGSGGHVTPVLAVINELAKVDPSLTVDFICDNAFAAQSRGLMKHATVNVSVETIMAGKFRRYHGEGWLDRILDWRTNLLNIRDLLFIALGFLQSIVKLVKNRPDAVFAKGGYVCLPMGLAAALLRVPIIIHDSDVRPGLTNKILSRFAVAIGTGSPVENYNYDSAKTFFVGVPIGSQFSPMNAEDQLRARHELGVIDVKAPLVVITGGGLGAASINKAMAHSGKLVVEADIHVYHITGKKHFDTIAPLLPEHPHYIAVPFVYKDMHTVLGAADLVVSRASATFLQELAGLAKPSIVIPAAHLGDQVKNAQVYKKADAVELLSDAEIIDSDMLATSIIDLMGDADRREILSTNLHAFARPAAATDMARMIARYVSKRDAA